MASSNPQPPPPQNPTGKRIVITGGSGKVGTHLIPRLLAAGHTILNLDITPSPLPNVHTLITDITQSGQVFNALTSHFRITEPFPATLPAIPDAVLHFAAHARPLMVPDDETFRVNSVGTWNVLDAACKLGVKKIVLASSVTVYGVTYAEGNIEYPSFPIDEDVDTNPMDVYAISKVCGERTARGLARRFNIDIYVLRLGAVIAPNEYQTAFAKYTADPEAYKVHGWSYTDARDLGAMCNLCVGRDGLGFQVFNATNDEITIPESLRETSGVFLRRVCPGVKFTREMGEREAPISNRRIKEVLGFKEEFRWREIYKAE